MIYLDANVFIYAALQDPQAVPQAQVAISYLSQLGKGEIEAATSVLSWDEVVWVASRLLERADATALGAWFLRLPNLALLPVTSEVALKAQSLVESHGLKPRDAIHAGSALTNHITELVSDDSAFDRVLGITRVKLSKS